MPYLHFVLDLGYLFTARTVLLMKTWDSRQFHWIRLEMFSFGKGVSIGLYSPDSFISNIKMAFRWRCKFFHKQEKILDGYTLEDWVKCSCGRKWRASEDL